MYQQQESSSEGTYRDEQQSPYGAYESFSPMLNHTVYFF